MNTKRWLTFRASTICFGIALAPLIILSFVGVEHIVHAQNPAAERIVYNFRPATGYTPSSVIARDSAGNTYGTTVEGGSPACGSGGGCGNIFKISPTGQLTTLHTFMAPSPFDAVDATGVILDGKGNAYGTTYMSGHAFVGTVFKLTPSGAYGTLHTFTGGTTDGSGPDAALVRDSAGNLYGTTTEGGGTGCFSSLGCGTIYKITPSGQETVLYSFTGGADGRSPQSSLVLDSNGNLYGTAPNGGNLTCGGGFGCGTVYKLDTSGNFTVLYTFMGGTDGAIPIAGLVMDSSGNLYGNAEGGGDLSCDSSFGCGVIFKIDSSGNFTVFYAFTGGANDGEAPQGALTRDSDGNLYGTTLTGGDQSCNPFGLPGCGVVFKLDASGNETILHTFAGGTTDGALAYATLIGDGKGTLYGSTQEGGTFNDGVIFAVRAQ